MLKPLQGRIEDLVFLHAHSGSKEDSRNRVYCVSAIIIGQDGSRRSFSSNVKYAHFTERERYYSNLSKEIILRAPQPEEVKSKIALFLKDQPVILVYNNHDNIKDVTDLCGVRRVIDLCFALEFFLPQAESYTPKALEEFLSGKKREKISYSSEEIAELSVKLVEYICGTVLDDRQYPHAAAVRSFLHKSNTLFGSVFTHIARNYDKYFPGLFQPCSKPDTANWHEFLERANSGRKRAASSLQGRIKPENIRGAFEHLAAAAPGQVLRPSQVEYACQVTEALNSGSVLAIEAGTGTGKTQGYLIPALEHLCRNPGSRIAVSTYTKNLQDQICQREIPFLQRHLKQYADIPVAVLKGKSNYVCAEKLANLYDDDMAGAQCLAWLYFLNVLFNFRAADLDSTGEKITAYLDENSSLRLMKNEISARTGCSDRHSSCPAQVIVAEAAASRLIVTNHHKLALLESDPSLSGLFRNFIIDEASHLENAIRHAVGKETSSRDLAEIIDYLESAAQRIDKKQGTAERLSGMKKSLGGLRSAIADLNQALKANSKSALYERSMIFNSSLTLGGRPIADFFTDLEAGIESVADEMQKVTRSKTAQTLKIDPRMVRRMKAARAQLTEYSDSISALLENMSSADKVTSYQVFPRHWTIKDEPVDIAEHARGSIHEGRQCVVFTSATLCDKGDFTLFSQIMGMGRDVNAGHADPGCRFAVLDSPFPTANRSIIVHDKAVNGAFRNKKNWLESLVETVPELVFKNKGRTLVLFASYDDLELVAGRVQEKIRSEGFPVLIQKRNTPTYNLCEEFAAVKESVLFGVDTFWYGVDFKGDTLTQVVITRIPFPNPRDPVQTARKNIFAPDDYWNRYRFETLIKLKQGIGRLIRSENDRGKIVILDSRYRGFVKDKGMLPEN